MGAKFAVVFDAIRHWKSPIVISHSGVRGNSALAAPTGFRVDWVTATHYICAMLKETIYSSLDFLVTRENGVVNLTQRNRSGVVIGVAALALALCGWWFHGTLNPASAHAMLLTFFCVLMGVGAALLLLSALYFTVRQRGHRFDPNSALATLRRRTYPMSEMTVPAIKTVSVGSTRIEALVMQHKDKEVTLLSSTRAGALVPVQQALSQAFAAAATSVGATQAPPVMPAQTVGTWRRFLPVFLLLFGALWSAVGYLTMPDVIIGSRRTVGGVLLWPLGLWLMVLGLLEAGYLWRGKSFFASKPQVVQLTLIALFATYFLICFR